MRRWGLQANVGLMMVHILLVSYLVSVASNPREQVAYWR
jgi:hypothetical protein